MTARKPQIMWAIKDMHGYRWPPQETRKAAIQMLIADTNRLWRWWYRHYGYRAVRVEVKELKK